MDARGAGDSAQPEGGYSIEQYARDVVGMADALGLDRFSYVGHSMGGGIGMQLGLEHADRLDKLVLVAPIPSGGITSDSEAHERERERRNAPNARADLLRERLIRNIRQSDMSVEGSLDRALSVSQAHYDDSWDAMDTFNVTHRLNQLLTPTLMVAGAADGLAEDNLRDNLRLPNATIHVFSRVGHGVPGDVPDAFAEMLADFLEHGVVNPLTEAARFEEATATVGVS